MLLIFLLEFLSGKMALTIDMVQVMELGPTWMFMKVRNCYVFMLLFYNFNLFPVFKSLDKIDF